ncbi:DNA mismatch repair protein Mlh3-like isoform X2 [Argiope bruennichi]|uniref:DNA mismatch repair protein Mlh3-like isoform X2 n=1 Tax=Argiope bruennichi TaxID=94029 RepID=UPI002495A744|nr:DNA mismatch repair protein Mlh3-like isoform X2 [Argiope bruennichi]
MKIHLLDPDVVKKLRSDLSFISVSHCVEELVWNSIDAGSTCIAVRLNLPFYKIQVIDNGNGIPPDQMVLVGKRYATSKCHSLEDLQNLQYGGFRGEALSSLKDVASNLMIESRASGCEETYCKIFNYGKAGTPTISISPRPSKGTTVTVFDFMYNRPVRKNAISEAIDVEDTCKVLQSIALVYPDISFSLLNEATGDMCLQFKKCTSSYFAFIQLFGQERAKNLKSCNHQEGNYKISGYISTDCFSSKNYQFLYVNRRLTLKTKLHKLINNLLSKVFGGKKSECNAPILPSPQMLSPSRNQYCCFILNISCPRNVYDIIFDRKRTMVEFSDWEKVTKLVQDAIVSFSSTEGLFSNLPVETNNLLLNEGDSVNPNSRFLNLGIDNFRNGLFSNAVKRLGVATEVSEIPNSELLNKEDSGEEYIKSQLNLQSEINSQDLPKNNKNIHTVHFNEKSTLNIKNGCNGSQTINHNKISSPKRNFICLKSSETSTLDNLRQIDNKSKIPDLKTNEDFSASPSTSIFESHSNIPCKSVFPTQNPIKLTVPMKSTLSMLERERKCSDALQKLKEKYLFMPKKNKLIPGKSEKLITSSIKINSTLSNNFKPAVNTVQSPILHNEINENKSKGTTLPEKHVDSTLTVNKSNSRITSKYAFNKETTLSPLKRLRRAKSSKTKVQMLPVNESGDKSNCPTNNVTNETEFFVDSKVHNPLKSHLKEKKSKISSLQCLQTFNNEINSHMTTKKKALFDSDYQNPIDNNRTTNLSQFGNCNPFLNTFHSSKQSTCLKNEEMVYNCDESNSCLKNFQDCAEPSLSPSELSLNDKSPCEIINDEMLSKMFTTKQFLQDSKIIRINDITVHDIKLQSDLEKANDFTELTTFSPSVSDDCDIEKFVSSGELDSFNNRKCTISNSQNDFLSNPHQNATSYDELQQDSKAMKSATLMNCNALTDNISPESCSSSVSLSDVDISIDKNSPASWPLQLESIKHPSRVSPENSSIINSPCKFQMIDKVNVVSETDSSNAVLEMNRAESDSLSSRISIIIDQEALKHSVCDPDDDKTNFSTKDQNILNEQFISPTKFLKKTANSDKKECLELINSHFISIPSFRSIGEEFTLRDELEEYINESNSPANTSSVSNFKSIDEEFISEHKTEEKINYENESASKSSLRHEENKLTNESSIDISCANDSQTKSPIINCLSSGTEKSFFNDNTESNINKSTFCIPVQGKSAGNRWICKVNENTKQVAYINSVTGNSTYFPPGSSPQVENRRITAIEDLSIDHNKKAHFFLTHDFSPFVSEFSSELPSADDEICDMQIDLDNHIEQTENNDWHRKWRYPVKDNETNDNSENIQNMFKEWENPIFQNPPEINSLEKSQVSMRIPHMYILNSYRFTQNCLNSMKVIGQVDCKFIACIMEDFSNNSKSEKLLVLFDQHAVHERVRLEELIEDLYEMKENKKVIKTVPVSDSLNVTFEPDEMRLLRSYHLSLRDIGFEISFQGDENTVSVYSLPSCLVNPTNNQPRKGISATSTLIEKIIKEWLNSLMQTRSTSNILPKTLNAVLNSQACKGAVKFGDPLDLSQCELLLAALSTCKLPFQCAHGRPSITPILDLNKINLLSKKRETPKLWKLHGVLESQ